MTKKTSTLRILVAALMAEMFHPEAPAAESFGINVCNVTLEIADDREFSSLRFTLHAADPESGDGISCTSGVSPDVSVEITGDTDARTIEINAAEGIDASLPFLDCEALIHWSQCCVNAETTSAALLDGTEADPLPEVTASAVDCICVDLCSYSGCGDYDGDGEVTASDALGVLQSAVGGGDCTLAACDYTGDGKITATDALAVLRDAVGLPSSPSCPE